MWLVRSRLPRPLSAAGRRRTLWQRALLPFGFVQRVSPAPPGCAPPPPPPLLYQLFVELPAVRLGLLHETERRREGRKELSYAR
jgi:hypothetical protein